MGDICEDSISISIAINSILVDPVTNHRETDTVNLMIKDAPDQSWQRKQIKERKKKTALVALVPVAVVLSYLAVIQRTSQGVPIS